MTSGPEVGFADKSADHRYFTIIPNIIFELGLSPHEFRLYATFKRVAGERAECFMTTLRLKRETNMGAGSISRGKAALVRLGLITISRRKRNAKGHSIDHITIVDVWNWNMTHFNKPSPVEHSPSPAKLEASPVERNQSPVERNRSTVETEEEPLNKNIEEEGVGPGAPLDEIFGLMCRGLEQIMSGTLNSFLATEIADIRDRFPDLTADDLQAALRIVAENRPKHPVPYLATVLDNRKASRSNQQASKSIPPAVKTFHDVVHRYPAKIWYSDVASVVGEAEDDLKLWFEVVKDWVGRGWKPTNVKGMLEVFQKCKAGLPLGYRARDSSGEPEAWPAIRAVMEEEMRDEQRANL